MHQVTFTQIARLELIEAQDWYEAEAPGLGGLFRAAVDVLVERMASNPRQFPITFQTVRRALLRRFPYSLLFVMEKDESLLVLACFHASRDPWQWQKRV